MINPLVLVALKLQVVGGHVLRRSLLPAKVLWLSWAMKGDLKDEDDSYKCVWANKREQRFIKIHTFLAAAPGEEVEDTLVVAASGVPESPVSSVVI